MLLDDSIDDEELNIILNNMEENLDSLDDLMNDSFKHLIFIGASFSDNPDIKDMISINLRLCRLYFTRMEDYEKLSKLKDLSVSLLAIKTTIVEETIINEVEINLN